MYKYSVMYTDVTRHSVRYKSAVSLGDIGVFYDKNLADVSCLHFLYSM